MVNYQTSSAQLIFLKLFLILLLLFAYFSPYFGVIRKVFADSYYPGFNVDNCKFSNVNGVSYSSLGNNVDYNPADVRGVDTNWVTTHRFTDVATPYYPDARRYENIADLVAVPPNTKVDVGMWVWNYTSHGVYVNSADLFMSKSNPDQGDVTKLGAEGAYGTTSWNTSIGQDSRSGKKISVPVQTSFGYHANDLGKVLYSFNTIQPIQLERVTPNYIWEGTNLKVRYDVLLKNVSSYDLCNININHIMGNGETHSENVCIGAKSAIFLSYFANFGTNYPLNISGGLIKITDPNRHTEIVASPNTSSQTDFRSIVIWRDDIDQASPAGVYGAQPGWGNTKGTFGVELIPYSFSANVPGTSLITQVKYTENVENLTAKENGRSTEVTSREFLPGDELLYTYNLRNSGNTIPSLNFISDIEKDNKIYDVKILSVDVNDPKSNYEINSLEEDEQVKINIPEFGLGEEREIKIKLKVSNVDFGEKLKLPEYRNEMYLASELKSKVEITNSTNTEKVSSEIVMNMKLAEAEININSSKLNYENYEAPTYNYEVSNTSKYKVMFSPILTMEGQELKSSDSNLDILNNGTWTNATSELSNTFTTKLLDSENQVSAKLHIKYSFKDENSNIYPEVIKYVEIGINQPDLSVSKKIVGSNDYTVGDVIGYEIDIVNNGNGMASGVSLKDTLTNSLVPVVDSLKVSGGSYDEHSRSINWSLGDIEANGKREIKYMLSINKEVDFIDGDLLVNSVSIKATNMKDEKNAESSANLRCASVSGIAWEDENRNGQVDSSEKLLNSQKSKVSISWGKQFSDSSYDLITDDKGKFTLNCVPYNKVISVKFSKPFEYSFVSSPIEYTFIFKNSNLGSGNLSEIESISQNENVEKLDSREKTVFLGVYNENKSEEPKILAVTGESINYGLLSSLVILIPSGLIILKRIKFKKFKSESRSK